MRRVLVVLVAGLAVYQAAKAVLWATQLDAVRMLVAYADHAIYMEAAARIRDGGSLYPAYQLAGPYSGGFLHSVANAPLLLIPIAAYVARRRVDPTTV